MTVVANDRSAMVCMEDTAALLRPIAVGPFLKDPHAALEACKQVADCLRTTGCVVIKDPRVDESDNTRFVDMMETYFNRDDATKTAEARPHLAYQVGVTPAGVEVPRCLVDPVWRKVIEQQPEGHRATMPTGPDVKWRYFWRLGPRPEATQYPELNAAPVIPEGLPDFAQVMDSWGSKMLAAVEAVAEMAALGLGLPQDVFSSRMRLGPHLLAPTGTDLSRHAELGTVYAGFHYDLNFLTIHGKSRFPGLCIWLRDGCRVPVRLPDGCLLLQAGKQLEWLTGGEVASGTHEVVCSEATLEAVEAAKQEGRVLWRVSSTMFTHIASDQLLQPLGHFATPEALAGFPATLAGEQVQAELEVLRLRRATPRS